MPIVIHNRLLPFPGFAAINICGIIFVRRGITMGKTEFNHEFIHTRQMLEMLVLPFYICYFAEWIIRLVRTHNAKRAYYEISFEREAYTHQYEADYIQKRPSYAWIKYLKSR